MKNTNELSDLEKLGHYFLENNPIEALNVLRNNILAEVNYKKRKYVG